MTTLLEKSTRIGSLILCTALTCSFAQAEDSARPDLGGVWTNASLTNLTRRSGVDTLVVTPEQAQVIAAGIPIGGIEGGFDEDDGVNNTPEAGGDDFGARAYNHFWVDPGSNLALVKGEYRTSYIVNPENGQVPRLENPTTDFKRTSFGSRYVTGIGNADGPEALPLSERCILSEGKAGPAMQSGLYNNNYEFVQTDNYVMINVEQMHDARIIPIFASATEARANRRPEVLQQYMGDSVGWYEDETLVVETINVNPQQMQQSSTAITENGKVTERFTRYSDNEIVYRFTVEDSDLYSQAWTAELSFYAIDGQLYEYACHEGNYSMPGTLAGARRLEAEQR
ncbi:MAG: hypothetical protein P8N94_12145 [Gammaproteobacteria bacterium]|jgi:hypothetical protein|nr:hypothetical protein [Gammaproteobacteria bacterium]MDG2338711.1 hypothetical protein [Gammaproteobacteria bacterium]